MKKSKWVLRIVMGVVVLLVVGVAAVWLMVDPLAKKAVQQGGEYALGVPTTVETMNLSLLGGSLRMDTLSVANPAGYKSDHLVRTGQFNLALQPGSVLTDTVRIPTLELNGLDLNIEAKGLASNIAEIMDHIKKLGGANGSSGSPQQSGGGKKVLVDCVVIRGVVAHVFLPVPGTSPLTINVPTIEMKNVSSDKPVDVAELIGHLMPAIVAAVLEQGRGIIPGDILAGLQGTVAGTVAALGGQAAQLLQQTSAAVAAQVGGALQHAGNTVPAAAQGLVEGAANQAQNTLQDATKAAAASLQQVSGGATSQPTGQKSGAAHALEGLFKKAK